MSSSEEPNRWWTRWLKCHCLQKPINTYANLVESNDQELDGMTKFEFLDLPNECLQEMFDRLDIFSLCQVADVSGRFRSVAEKSFCKRYNELDYKDVGYKRPLLRRVLCRFGHLITTFDDGYCILRVNEQIDLYAIPVYCTNLKELSLRGAIIDCEQMKQIFPRLNSLKLVWCEFRGSRQNIFRNCLELETLYIHHVGDGSFIAKKFPKLVDLRYDTSSRNDSTLLKLMKRNPQIRRLLIPAGIDDFFISAVVQHTPKVDIFRSPVGIMPKAASSMCTEQGFMQLSQLKKLKSILLNTKNEVYKNSMAALMTALSQKNVPLEIVYLWNFSIHPQDMKSFTNLKSITYIVLHEIEACSDDDVVALVNGLPSLQVLMMHFTFNKRNNFSVVGLVSAVKDGRELLHIHLNAIQRLINRTVFEQLAEAVKSQWVFRDMKALFIQICACSCTSGLDVSIELRRDYANRFWFNVDFTEPRFKCVNCSE